MAHPFVALNDSPHNITYSADTSYLRDNIAVPTQTYGKSAATVVTDADTELESRLPSGTTAANEPTPASVAA